MQAQLAYLMNFLLYIIIGLFAGVGVGALGIGGGIVMVPALIYISGFTQHQAQGTSLATMLPPVGLLAVWEYYKNGNANLKIALLLCVGVVIGAYIGAIVVQHIPPVMLKKIFGAMLLLVAVKMIVF